MLAPFFKITSAGSTTGLPIITPTCSSITYTISLFHLPHCCNMLPSYPLLPHLAHNFPFTGHTLSHAIAQIYHTHIALVHALPTWLFLACSVLHQIHSAVFLSSCNFACLTACFFPRSGCSQGCCKLYVRNLR